jgi:hypothetical protein
MIAQINGVSIPINGIDDNSEYQMRLIGTLGLLPPRHLQLLHHVTVRDRADYAGGSTNWLSASDHSAGLWIMIDMDSFDPRQREINNRPPNFFHYTLLHEMGHVVEHSYHGLRYVRTHDRAGYRAMLRRPHTGGGPGGETEHFADTYADYFFYSEAQMPTDERMRAMLRTPAFADLGAPRRSGLPGGTDRRLMMA